MNPQLFHIYGPLYVQWYGVWIVIALLVFMWRAHKHELCKKLFAKDQLVSLVMRSIFVGFVGGKLLHIISAYHEYSSWQEILYFWEGGLSILGAVLALLIYVPYYLYSRKIPLGLACDFLAIYAPLLQSIARIGCFFAGCCYGAQTLLPWAVIYSDVSVAAPCNVPLHPTQLYSAGVLFIFFLTLRFVVYPLLRKKHALGWGLITCLYLALMSMERFVIDFFRADRVINDSSALIQSTVLSMHQWVALGIFGVSIAGFIGIYIVRRAHAVAEAMARTQGERDKRSSRTESRAL